jgi:uncharacterized iron-regulated protein
MFTVDDAPVIARHLASHPSDATGLAEAVHWQRSGWPDWAMYRPIVEAVLQANLPVIAANLSRVMMQSLGRSGTAALDATFAARYGLDRPLAPALQEAMTEEIRAAHCGYAADPQVNAMLLVQRARDAQMADSLSTAGQQDGAVLIAGAGHVRRDSGVPLYLARHVPEASVLSVAFLEVSQDGLEPTAYARSLPEHMFPFDYVWFTPRVDEQDPCSVFEEHLKKLQQSR